MPQTRDDAQRLAKVFAGRVPCARRKAGRVGRIAMADLSPEHRRALPAGERI